MRSAKRRVHDILAALATAAVASIAAVARAQTAAPPLPAPEDLPGFQSVGGWLRSRMPTNLREVGFLLEQWQWLGILAVIVLGAAIARLVAVLAYWMGRRPFERAVPSGNVDSVRRCARAIGILLGAGAARLGFATLGLPKAALAPLLVGTSFVASAAAVLIAYRLADIFTAYLVERARRTPSRTDDVLAPLIRSSRKFIVIVFGILFIAGNLNVDISSLLAGLGLGGLAFALAAQDTVKNLFGSVTVLLDKPFQVGDSVIIGALEGTVEEVGLRSTRIRTPSDSLVTVPNANLIAANVENLGSRRWRRWLTRLRVAYDTPPETIEAFCEGIRDLIRSEEDARKDGNEVWANEFGTSGIEIVLSVYCRVYSGTAELAFRHRLLLDILRLAARLDIAFALPTQTVRPLHAGEAPPPVTIEDPTTTAVKAAVMITRMPETPS